MLQSFLTHPKSVHPSLYLTLINLFLGMALETNLSLPHPPPPQNPSLPIPPSLPLPPLNLLLIISD